MPLLADLQAGVRQAVTLWDPGAVSSLLVGGVDPVKRLAIHQRHYEASLVTAICEKFPATAWLVGADVVADAASVYVRTHPPQRPCIAEYGEDFPPFLARHVRVPSLQSFAELEWHVGQVSIAVDDTPVTWSQIVQVGSEARSIPPSSIFVARCSAAARWATRLRPRSRVIRHSMPGRRY